MSAISLDALTKRYDDATALDELTLEIDTNTVLGLIGPNGAGKTTLFRILSGQIDPSAGHARVFEHDVESDRIAVQRQTTLLPQRLKSHFYTFTPREYIYHYHRISGADRREAKQAVREAIQEFDIDYADKTMDELSGGMVKRVMLAMVLTRDTPLYLLDEPTADLDPDVRRELWGSLRDRLDDSTIVITSHHTDEIASVCDEVALLNDGELVLRGSPETIAREYLPQANQKLVVEEQCDIAKNQWRTEQHGRFRYIYPACENERAEIQKQLADQRVSYDLRPVGIGDIYILGWVDDDQA